MTHPHSTDTELRGALRQYRLQNDMAYSEYRDGFVTLEEWEKVRDKLEEEMISLIRSECAREAEANLLKRLSGGKCMDNDKVWRGISLTPEEVTEMIAELSTSLHKEKRNDN